MSKRKKIYTALNILSVLFLLLAAAIIFLMFAANNRYGEPVFGDTMLVCVTDENLPAGGHNGSLAVVDLSGKSGNGNYVAFIGSGIRISGDPMANIGRVSFYIPFAGAVLGFFRLPAGFFLALVLPLAILINFNAVRLVLLIRERKKGGGI